MRRLRTKEDPDAKKTAAELLKAHAENKQPVDGMEYKNCTWVARSVLSADLLYKVAEILDRPGAKAVDQACSLYLAMKENEDARPKKKQDSHDVERIRETIPGLIQALSNPSAMAELMPYLQEMRFIDRVNVPPEIITSNMADIIEKLKYIHLAAERSPIKKQEGRGGNMRKNSPGYILVSTVKRICDDHYRRDVRRSIHNVKGWPHGKPSDPVGKILAIVQETTGSPLTGVWKEMSQLSAR